MLVPRRPARLMRSGGGLGHLTLYFSSEHSSYDATATPATISCCKYSHEISAKPEPFFFKSATKPKKILAETASIFFGAQERTRTSTGLLPHPPQGCVYTKFHHLGLSN